jgi:hypothetical protein
MATKTETKTAQIPSDIEQYISEILNALKRALETGDFEIRIYYDSVAIKIPDVKAYVYKNLMRIMYKDIDIVYSNYYSSRVVTIKVYKDPYSYPDEYYAHDYWAQLEEIHELAKEKVKYRLEKVIGIF